MSVDTLRVLLVDDESLARDSLRLALTDVEDLVVVGQAGSAASAVEAIRTLDPDLVLLDVQMPDADGFGVIEAVGVDRMPLVVFVTAYDAHALRAFEVHAVDYVLKPFEDERLIAAVERARGRLTREPDGSREQLTRLVEALRADPARRWASRIMVRVDDRIRFERTDRIDYLEAAGNHVLIHVGDATHRVRGTLRGLAAQLDPQQFVRIHRSTVVNLDRVAEVQPWFGGDYVAILTGGRQLKVSRTYRDDLLRTTR